MYYKVEGGISSQTGPVISIKCPHCGHNGTFHSLLTSAYLSPHSAFFGMRYCPNESCLGLIFYIQNSNGIQTYPSATITFDKKNIPPAILAAMEESLICHSNNCFVASGIMIRKTLEVLCEENSAKGANLKERLKALGKTITLPKELIDGMDELRLLGNDAAHVEAQTFNQVGKEEIEISILFTVEVLKAIYQYEDLLAKLRSLKKT